jgi:membrane fusion protein, multidrug efflux system
VRLESASYVLELKQAEAALAAARAQHVQLAADVARFRTLLERSAITRTDLDRLQTQLQVAEANLEVASARRDQADKRMTDSVVKAPFAGSVVERGVQVGEYVRPDSKVLRLVSSGPLRLTLDVPESAISRIRAGQTLDFEVAAFGEERFSGTVKYLPAGLREHSRDFVVEAEVNNADGRLRPGMFASAQLVVGESLGVVVPETSVRRDGNNHRVYVAADGRVQERLVELGEVRDGRAEIRKGLAAGDRVVTAPGPEVQDGVPVRN